MSYTTEATVFPSFVEFVTSTVDEVELSSYATTALQWVDKDDSELLEMPIKEYVQYALDNSDFQSMIRDSLEMTLMEQGKSAIYAPNNGRVVVVNLPA